MISPVDSPTNKSKATSALISTKDGEAKPPISERLKGFVVDVEALKLWLVSSKRTVNVPGVTLKLEEVVILENLSQILKEHYYHLILNNWLMSNSIHHQ
mgnify:CR=1 FL=1